MEQIRGKVIYNAVLSVLMAYFIFRSFFIFYGYLFQYEDKLFAKGEIHFKINEPVTIEQLKAAVPNSFEKIDTDPENSQISVAYKAPDFEALREKKQSLLKILQNKFPDGSYDLLQTQLTPPEVSKRIFRLELTVHIPLFIMALFWFGYIFRWYREIKKAALRQPAQKK